MFFVLFTFFLRNCLFSSFFPSPSPSFSSLDDLPEDFKQLLKSQNELQEKILKFEEESERRREELVRNCSFKDEKVVKKSATEKTLVVYAAWEEGDAEYKKNLEFFLKTAVRSNDNVHYVFVISGSSVVSWPKFNNVEVIYKESKCWDFGSYRLGLEYMKSRLLEFKYIVFINNSIRGPFMSRPARIHMHWTEVFSSLINEEVKLSGVAINCPPDLQVPPLTPISNPHVQGYLMAMDKIGLDILLRTPGVLDTCHGEKDWAIYYSELGASKAILDAGFNIASVLLGQEGVDFRDRKNWACNRKSDPMFQDYDDTELHPIESVFYKMKSSRELPLTREINNYVDYLLGRRHT